MINNQSYNSSNKPVAPSITESTITRSAYLNGIFCEAETLLHNAGQLTDSLSLLTENALSASGQNDNFSVGWSSPDFHTGVTIFGQLTLQKFVQLSFEDTIVDKLQTYPTLENKDRIIPIKIMDGTSRKTGKMLA